MALIPGLHFFGGSTNLLKGDRFFPLFEIAAYFMSYLLMQLSISKERVLEKQPNPVEKLVWSLCRTRLK